MDAPITSDQLEADGRLRVGGSHHQAAFEAEERDQTRAVIQVSAVLAAQADGPLEDRNEFSGDVGSVHLHLRADGLLEPRPVVYRWTHDDLSVLVPGILAPSDSLSLGTSLDIDPELTGHWQVEVLSRPEQPDEPPRVLFHREFEVERPSS